MSGHQPPVAGGVVLTRPPEVSQEVAARCPAQWRHLLGCEVVVWLKVITPQGPMKFKGHAVAVTEDTLQLKLAGDPTQGGAERITFPWREVLFVTQGWRDGN